MLKYPFDKNLVIDLKFRTPVYLLKYRIRCVTPSLVRVPDAFRYLRIDRV